MVLDTDYRPLSPAELMKISNDVAVYTLKKETNLDMSTTSAPTNKNGKFSQIGKKPTGKPPKPPK